MPPQVTHYLSLCTSALHFKRNNGCRDMSKTVEYLPNVSFRHRHRRRRGGCCERLVCVSSVWKNNSDCIFFLLLMMDGWWILDSWKDIYLKAYVPLGFSCPQKPETLTIGMTQRRVNNSWLIRDSSLCICGASCYVFLLVKSEKFQNNDQSWGRLCRRPRTRGSLLY